MSGHSELLKNGNPWAMERFERWLTAFVLERWMKLGRKEARSSRQEKHQWVGMRIKGSMSSLYSAGLVECQGFSGPPPGVAAFPAPPWAPVHLLLLTEWGTAWLTVHVSIGSVHAGWHTRDSFTHTCNWCLVDRTFLELECRRSPRSHVALHWKSWWETSAGLVTHKEPGIGCKEFGLAH